MQFKYGFEFNRLKYGWHKKELYRLPCLIGARYYSLKKMKSHLIGTTLCWNIYKHKMTKNQLEKLTVKVNWKIESLKNSDVPF